jgi:hypothetical protein
MGEWDKEQMQITVSGVDSDTHTSADLDTSVDLGTDSETGSTETETI